MLELLNYVPDYATLVSLIATFQAGRSSKEAQDIQLFNNYLIENNHREIVTQLESNYKLLVFIKMRLNFESSKRDESFVRLYSNLEKLSDRSFSELILSMKYNSEEVISKLSKIIADEIECEGRSISIRIDRIERMLSEKMQDFSTAKIEYENNIGSHSQISESLADIQEILVDGVSFLKNYICENRNSKLQFTAIQSRILYKYQLSLRESSNVKLFNDKNITLKDVCIPLRAYVTNSISQNMPHNEVIDLEAHLIRWISGSQISAEYDFLKLVQGGPGSGKSTFAKLFSEKIIQMRPDIPVIYLELRSLVFENSISSDTSPNYINCLKLTLGLEEYLGVAADAVLNMRKYVLILDGLDELASIGENRTNHANDFVDSIISYFAPKNRSNEREIRIIITGRPGALSAATRSNVTILNLLSYYPSIEQRTKLNDENNLLETDQRSIWWAKYRLAKGYKNTDFPDIFRRGDLDRITAEPLLLYLLASTYSEEIEFAGQVESLNDLYFKIVSDVYDRRYEGSMVHASISDIFPKQYLDTLKVISYVAWNHGLERSVSSKKIRNFPILKLRTVETIECKEGFQGIEEIFGAAQNRAETAILTFFFVKKSLIDNIHENEFVFSHRTFQEYFNALFTIDVIREICAESGKEHARESLSKWFQFSSGLIINESILTFIKGEFVKLNRSEAHFIHQKLSELVGLLIEEGLTIYVDRGKLNLFSALEKSSNSEIFLFLCLSCLSGSAKIVSDIKISKPEKFAIWHYRNFLNYSESDMRDVVYNNLTFLTLHGLNNLKFEIELVRNLSGSDISRTNLNSRTISDCRFIETYCEYSNFYETSFNSCDLNNAHFKETIFEKCRFLNSRMDDSNFYGCNFIDIDFTNKDLSKTKFNFGEFNRGKIGGCDTSRLTFKNVTFNEVEFTSMDLSDVELCYSVFKRCNLEEVKLPKKLNGLVFESVTFSKFIDGLSFAGVKLIGINIDNVADWSVYTESKKCDFSMSVLIGCSISLHIFSLMNIKGVEFDNVTLREDHIKDISLSVASSIRNGIFSRKKLTNVVFDGLNLSEVFFINSKIEHCSFVGCTVKPENFSGATINRGSVLSEENWTLLSRYVEFTDE